MGLMKRIKRRIAEKKRIARAQAELDAEIKEDVKKAAREAYKEEEVRIAKVKGKALARQKHKGRFAGLKVGMPDLWGEDLQGKPLNPEKRRKLEQKKRKKQGIA